MSGLSRGCRTCCQKQQNKIQPANKKASANFSGAKRKYEVHIFQQEASFRRHLCFRVGRPASPIYIQQPQRPTRQSPNAFLQLLFSRRENTRCIFFSIQNHCFRLDRPTSPTVNPLFIPVPQPSTRQLIPFRRQPADSLLSYFFTEPNASPRPPAHSFRRQPANISRHHSFHTGPTIFNKPTPFLPAWPSDVLHPFQPLF